MFNVGDRVTLSDTEMDPGWAGLTATVCPGVFGSDTRIRLDEGLSRPDSNVLTEFYWPTTALTLIEPSDNDPDEYAVMKSSYEARITDLERQRSEANARAIMAQSDLEQFKARVQEVATRYAIENDWCSVVASALEELGLSATRTVRYRFVGYGEVEVPLGCTASVPDSISDITVELDSDYDNQSVTLEDVDAEEYSSY